MNIRGRNVPALDEDLFFTRNDPWEPWVAAEISAGILARKASIARNLPHNRVPIGSRILLRQAHGFLVSLAAFPEIFPALRRSRFLARYQPNAIPGWFFPNDAAAGGEGLRRHARAGSGRDREPR